MCVILRARGKNYIKAACRSQVLGVCERSPPRGEPEKEEEEEEELPKQQHIQRATQKVFSVKYIYIKKRDTHRERENTFSRVLGDTHTCTRGMCVCGAVAKTAIVLDSGCRTTKGIVLNVCAYIYITPDTSMGDTVYKILECKQTQEKVLLYIDGREIE